MQFAHVTYESILPVEHSVQLSAAKLGEQVYQKHRPKAVEFQPPFSTKGEEEGERGTDGVEEGERHASGHARTGEGDVLSGEGEDGVGSGRGDGAWVDDGDREGDWRESRWDCRRQSIVSSGTILEGRGLGTNKREREQHTRRRRWQRAAWSQS